MSEEHTNLGGTLHGGMTATMVDTISTFALLTTEPYKPGVSVDLSVSWVASSIYNIYMYKHTYSMSIYQILLHVYTYVQHVHMSNTSRYMYKHMYSMSIY